MNTTVPRKETEIPTKVGAFAIMEEEECVFLFQRSTVASMQQDSRICYSTSWSGVVQGSRVQLGPRYCSKAGLKTS